jgi:hypothetical protein
LSESIINKLYDIYPELDLDCWDYVFDKSAHTLVWMAQPKDVEAGVCTYSTHPMWHFLFVADTRQQLHEDIIANLEHVPGNLTEDSFEYVQIPLHGILSWWRMLRYNGRKLCVMGASDLTPTNAFAYPGGPVAPVRNAFVFTAKRKQDRELMSIMLKDIDLPVCAANIPDIIASAEIIGIEASDFMDNYDIIASNILELVLPNPLIFWYGKPFPLIHIINLNPNHNGDPEEELLASND